MYRPARNGDCPLLEVRGLTKAFDATQALENAHFAVEAGSVHALLGENGAGKSTMIRIISGAVQPDAGEILLDGREVPVGNPAQAMALGISVVYQELSLFPELTVAENIALLDQRLRRRTRFVWAGAAEAALNALQRLGSAALSIDPWSLVADLRVDQRQLVEIARVLHIGARLVVLDEPTSSLSRPEVEVLFNVIRRLAERGVAFLFVSHRLAEIRELCDRVTVLRNGRTVLFSEGLDDVTDESLITAMAGSEFSELMSTERPATRKKRVGSELFRLVQRNGSGTVEFHLSEGEIVGLAGLAGSGRSSLLRRIYGVQEADRRTEIFLYGKQFRPRGPRTSIAHRIAYVGEDRRELGILPGQPLVETLVTPLRVARNQRFVRRGDEEVAATVMERLWMVGRIDQPVETLSGGNQQKAVVGRWLPLKPRLFLLDEPTRGVDVRSKAELHRLMQSLADEGAGILIVSSEIQELVALADRIVVLSQGSIVGSLEGGTVTEDEVLRAMIEMRRPHGNALND